MKNDVFIVVKKDQKDRIELFYSLEVFCQTCTQYNPEELAPIFEYGTNVFEYDLVRIENRPIIYEPKPNFQRMFFWDFDYDRINWEKRYVTVIQRMLERGFQEHWNELIRFYGRETIIHALREKIVYLPDFSIDNTCSYFGLKK